MATQETTPRICRWTSAEIREQRKEELEAMRYIAFHSRHMTTSFGAAPNTTVRQEEKQLASASRDSVRVLRYA